MSYFVFYCSLFICKLSNLSAIVSPSSGCLGWPALLYCGTTWAFHIITFKGVLVAFRLVTFRAIPFQNCSIENVLW